MDFSRFLLNFTEFGRLFQKPTELEGTNFLVPVGFLNTDSDVLNWEKKSMLRGICPLWCCCLYVEEKVKVLLCVA
jgi:hypothetical protein